MNPSTPIAATRRIPGPLDFYSPGLSPVVTANASKPARPAPLPGLREKRESLQSADDTEDATISFAISELEDDVIAEVPRGGAENSHLLESRRMLEDINEMLSPTRAAPRMSLDRVGRNDLFTSPNLLEERHSTTNGFETEQARSDHQAEKVQVLLELAQRNVDISIRAERDIEEHFHSSGWPLLMQEEPADLAANPGSGSESVHEVLENNYGEVLRQKRESIGGKCDQATQTGVESLQPNATNSGSAMSVDGAARSNAGNRFVQPATPQRASVPISSGKQPRNLFSSGPYATGLHPSRSREANLETHSQELPDIPLYTLLVDDVTGMPILARFDPMGTKTFYSSRSIFTSNAKSATRINFNSASSRSNSNGTHSSRRTTRSDVEDDGGDNRSSDDLLLKTTPVKSVTMPSPSSQSAAASAASQRSGHRLASKSPSTPTFVRFLDEAAGEERRRGCVQLETVPEVDSQLELHSLAEVSRSTTLPHPMTPEVQSATEYSSLPGLQSMLPLSETTVLELSSGGFHDFESQEDNPFKYPRLSLARRVESPIRRQSSFLFEASSSAKLHSDVLSSLRGTNDKMVGTPHRLTPFNAKISIPSFPYTPPKEQTRMRTSFSLRDSSFWNRRMATRQLWGQFLLQEKIK